MSEPTEPTNDMNEDDLIDAALAALDQEPLPTTTLPEPEQAEPHQAATADLSPAADSPVSQTLAALEETRRPKASTVCERCPHSVWFASPAEVKCYCRVMFLVTWSSKEPNQITNCDGIYLGQE